MLNCNVVIDCNVHGAIAFAVSVKVTGVMSELAISEEPGV